MRILIVKLSSLGDLIHAFPAVSELLDLTNTHASSIDWLVDSDFESIPPMHPGISQVFSLPLRRLKRQGFCLQSWQDLKLFFQQLTLLRKQPYHHIIDAQGLFKSALITAAIKWTTRPFSQVKHRPQVHGFDKNSIREEGAACFYDKSHPVSKGLHAIHRIRVLCAQALQYPCDLHAVIQYGLPTFKKSSRKTVIFLHGSSWPSKEWPKEHWIALAHALIRQDPSLQIQCLFGNTAERQRAIDFQNELPASNFQVIPCQTLPDLLPLLGEAWAVISVDSGLGHLSAALNTPVIGLFGPTDPNKTGFVTPNKYLSNQTIQATGFECMPCKKRFCRLQAPPEQHKAACMEALPVKEVAFRLHFLFSPPGFIDAQP